MKAKKEVKLKELEQSWDSDVRYPKESKRYVRMSNDVENFVKNSSYSASPYTNESPQSFNNPNKTSFRTSSGDNSDMFSRISSTFGFKHHLGTDKKLELKVIKIILIRENILMNLRHQSDKSLEQANIDNSCGHIIQLLAQLRECTLNYLEALCMWRESAHHNASGHGQGPPAFIWENMNYTIKIVNDLDFIAENYLLVEALNMDPVQLQSNPLMLANNLEDSNTWMSPQERAASDCNGNGNAAYYQNRLRLRFAERIILQEIEAATVALSQNNSANNSVMMPRSTPDYGNYSHFDKGSAAFDDNSCKCLICINNSLGWQQPLVPVNLPIQYLDK